jgi:hypothetical protein
VITKAQVAQIDALLSDLVKLGGMNYVSAVKVARRSLAEATEGRHLPQQLKRAQRSELLPLCAHDKPLMDWSGEQLVPPCGCRLVEPTDTIPTWKEIVEGKSLRGPASYKPAKPTKGDRK